MFNNDEPELPEIILELIKGFMLLIFLHFVVFILLAFIDSAIEAIDLRIELIFDSQKNKDTSIGIGSSMALSIPLSQLLYVIPLVIWLKRRRKTYMRKGVILAAVMTGLFYGATCYLLIRSFSW